jgi:hypothetical protein
MFITTTTEGPDDAGVAAVCSAELEADGEVAGVVIAASLL